MPLRQITDDIIHLGRTIFRFLPDVTGTGIQPLETIPEIPNIELVIFNNTIATTVTNFKGGAQYRTIAIKGDGFTTLKNNTTIKTNTGADKLLASTKIYHLTLIDEVWFENS